MGWLRAPVSFDCASAPVANASRCVTNFGSPRPDLGDIIKTHAENSGASTLGSHSIREECNPELEAVHTRPLIFTLLISGALPGKGMLRTNTIRRWREAGLNLNVTFKR